MAMKPVLTAKQVTEWERLLGKHRPAPVKPEDTAKAVEITSFNTGGHMEGLFLRVSTGKGFIDLFLNAAVAIQMADVIRQNGIACAWMNEDDGSVIVTDPQNLHHLGPKH